MKELTKGFPAKVIIMFAIPLMIGNIAQQLYNITDSKIVSLYVGTDALGAVGATGSISNFLIGLVNGLTQGFSIVAARHFGAKKEEELRRTVAGSIILVSIFTIVLTVLGIIMTNPVLRVLKTPDNLLDGATSYLSIIVMGLCFSALYNMSANILRAIGDSKRPLYCLFISIVLNIALDLLFAGKFGWGIKGAAYATIIAQAVCSIACTVILFYSTKQVVPKRNDFKLTVHEYGELLTFGMSMALMGSIVNIGTIILQSAINSLGKTLVTAHISARRILDIMMVMVYTIGFAMTTYVSQNYGAMKYQRIKDGVRHSLIMVTIISTVLVVFCFAFARPLVSWIASSDDNTIINNGELYLKTGVVFFYFLGPLFIFRCSMQGMGSRFVPILTSTMELVIKILSVLFLVPKTGYLGVALTEPISWVLMAIVLFFGYNSCIRKQCRTETDG